MLGKALHTKSIWKSNLMTDIRLASEAGFGAMEVASSKIWDYLSSGSPLSDVTERLKQYDMQIISINDIANVERTDDDAVRNTLAETEKLSAVAQQLGCDCIQLVPLLALEGRSEDEVIELTAKNIARICDIGAKYGVRFQLEPVGWSPINSLRLTQKLIQAVGRDNFGTVIDFSICLSAVILHRMMCGILILIVFITFTSVIAGFPRKENPSMRLFCEVCTLVKVKSLLQSGCRPSRTPAMRVGGATS